MAFPESEVLMALGSLGLALVSYLPTPLSALLPFAWPSANFLCEGHEDLVTWGMRDNLERIVSFRGYNELWLGEVWHISSHFLDVSFDKDPCPVTYGLCWMYM